MFLSAKVSPDIITAQHTLSLLKLQDQLCRPVILYIHFKFYSRSTFNYKNIEKKRYTIIAN